MNRSTICSRRAATPDLRNVSSTSGVMIVTGCARLISGSRNLVECILTKCAQYTITAHAVQCSMFNSTHTLVGLLIAKTGVGKWAKYGTATAVIASNLPDIDSIAGFWGTAAYIDYHRGITHSLIGVPLLALLLAGVMYPF